ncbi:hypothetical protein JCM10450v2_001417 [Rhodotorula kratochvilovae]
MALARPSVKGDVLWALHTFEAENDDELAFEAGERIIVLERDDQYGDGWFQGRNERGEVGLFPQSYTSSRPPSFFPPDTPDSDDSPVVGSSTAATTISPPTPDAAPPISAFAATVLPPDEGPVEHETLSPTLGARRRDSVSETSVHSRVDDDDFDDAASAVNVQRPSDGAAHRAALAARAMENAEKAAQEERERAERRRKEDEERYENVRKSGLIEGLQLSDESDEEGDDDEAEGPLALPVTAEAPAGEVAELKDEAERPVLPGTVSTTSIDGLPPPETRPRADTQTSVYAESVYSNNSSIPPIPSPPVAAAAIVPSPSIAAASLEPAPSSAAELASPPPADSPSSDVALPGAFTIAIPAPSSIKGDETPRSPTEPPSSAPGAGLVDSLKSTTESAATAISVGAAGLVAAATTAVAAAGVGLASDSPKEEAHVAEPVVVHLEEEQVALPQEAQAALETETSAAAAAPPPPEETALPAHVNDDAPAPPATPAQATAEDAAVEASTAVDVAPAANAAPAVDAAPASEPGVAAASAVTPAAALVASTRAVTPTPPAAAPATQPASPVSLDQSRASSPATGTAPLSASIITAATTATAPTSEKGEAKELPADPMNWSVDDVVEWGRQKGFDGLTVGKFAEHEISGDVLLEMDVAMLKEIDLIAFGRRVHIYNAIKELKLRTQPPPPPPPHPVSALSTSQSTSGGSFLSPATSGYEPDSPHSYGPSSPIAAAFQHAPHARWEQQQERLAGLGFEDDSAPGSLRASSSLGQQSVSNLRAARSIPSSVDGPASAASHTRSTTVDSAQSVPVAAPSPPLAKKPISEEPASGTTADEGSATDVAAAPALKPKTRPSTASSLRPRSSRRGSEKGKTAGDSSATSTPSSPVIGNQERKSSKGDKASFFGASLPLPGRSRKPPPRVPSTLLIDSDGAVARPRPRTSLQDRAKRSTRLFSSFGTGSGSDRSPTAVESVRSRPSNSTLGGGRDAPTAMTVKSVDPATKEMLREKNELVTSGNLMDKIGRPDNSGWMRKKGEKYNTWKMRFFVLKGTYLYYLKSEAEQKAKGVIDLTGYRVISDPSIHPGEYGFKIVHDRERTHFFAAAEQITVRNWMKEIIKATILRDYSAPVVSSCDIEVLPLEKAKTMVPYPRPPSPSRRAEIQKERYAGTNPNTLSQKDAAILMDFAPGSPLMNGEDLFSSVASSKRPSIGTTGSASRNMSAATVKMAKAEAPSAAPPAETAQDASSSLAPAIPAQPVAEASTGRLQRALSETTNAELLAWMNQNLPSSCPLATDLALSLRSGRLLVRLLENLSGESSEITDGQFEMFHQQEGEPFDTAYLDTIFSVFDFLTPRVSTDDVSMEDMIAGREPRLSLLVSRIRTKYQPVADSAAVATTEA